jgi:serine/threonine-protein kinase
VGWDLEPGTWNLERFDRPARLTVRVDVAGATRHHQTRMTDLPDPLIGRLVDDTWRLERFVARGSMGAVYQATDLRTATPVAVKVLNPEYLGDREIRERFGREATISSRCDSAFLVKVLNLCTGPDGYVYLVMEWLAGETLAAYLRRRGRLPLSEAVTLLVQVGRGLAAAHAAGIIHRDVKPGNVFLAEVGEALPVVPKILDFGISKILGEGSTLTATATMMGTPHYMPVEQFDSSRDVDQRADLYALGVIGYELVAGRRPYDGANAMQILNQISQSPPPPLPADVPAEIAQVILKAMARRVEDRHASVVEFVGALNEAAARCGVAADVRLLPVVRRNDETRPVVRHRPGSVLSDPARRRLVLGLVAGGAGLALVGGGLALLLGRGQGRGRRTAGGPTSAGPETGGFGERRAMGPAGAGARGLAVDAAGRTVAAVDGQGRLAVLDAATGGLRWELAGPASAVALSADGQWLAVALGGRTVKLYTAPAGAEVRTVTPEGQVRGLAFSADANRLATAGADGRATVWDVRTGRVVASFDGVGGGVSAVALSGDGGVLLAGGATGTLAAWDVAQAASVGRLPGHGAALTAVALHDGGQVAATAAVNGEVALWTLPGLGLRARFPAHADGPVRLIVAEDGRHATSGGADGLVRIWETATGREAGRVALETPVTALAAAQGGAALVVGSQTGRIQVLHRSRRAPARR